MGVARQRQRARIRLMSPCVKIRTAMEAYVQIVQDNPSSAPRLALRTTIPTRQKCSNGAFARAHALAHTRRVTLSDSETLGIDVDGSTRVPALLRRAPHAHALLVLA